MQGSPNSRPLKVLLVAEDRRVLRHLSKSLTTFGYDVRQAAEPQQAVAALEGDAPDLLILDAEPNPPAALELCRSLTARESPRGLFTYLLVQNPTPQLLTEALEAGVDDFLTRPIVYGELLTRLRAGARVLEFDRRCRRQSAVEPLTGLRARLFEAHNENAGLEPGACVLIDLDVLRRINRFYGHPGGDAVIRAVAERLRTRCSGNEALACLGAGRFCVWLPGVSGEEAAAWAEATRAALEATEVSLHEASIRFTASFGVAANEDPASTPEAVLARAENALQTAKHSGRNCVVRDGDLKDDASVWSDFAAPGKLFERTRARDVMTPCTILLQPEQSLSHAATLFERSRQAVLPVVNADGETVGVVFQEEAADGQGASQRVEDVMNTDVPTYDEGTEFAALRDFFTRDSRSVVVITYHGKPTGLVTPDNLAALSQPLASDTFAPASPYSDTSDYLVVPDLQPLADAS